MALGEYNSMTAQAELLQRELDLERSELRRHPESEQRELAQIYRSRGLDRQLADSLASEVMRDPELALETHAREELGISPSSLGSPLVAAASSLASFALGAVLPLLPWFFAGGRGSLVASLIIGAVTAVSVGAALAGFTRRSVVRSALRQLLFLVVGAAASYGLGSAVGINVG